MTATLTEAYHRRIAAFEEFYNHNHSKTDGKFSSGIAGGSSKGKVWSGVSAHPDHRVVPKPKVTIPPKGDEYQTAEQVALGLGQRIYAGNLGGGFHSRVTSTEVVANTLTVHIKITDKDGKQVGLADRMVSTEKGKLIVDHTNLFIDEAYHGKGIADRFNAHSVAQYQQLGVDHITLHAADKVGGFAWARQGFRMNEEGSDGTYRKTFLLQQLDRTKTTFNIPVLSAHKAKLNRDVAALRKAIEAGEDVQPIHIAALGEKYARYKRSDPVQNNEYTTWPGKNLLLGTSWHGVYYFDASHAITAAASNLEHARLRSAFTEDNTDPNMEDLACHDKECAPPPVGTGGSTPSGKSAGLGGPSAAPSGRTGPEYTMNIRNLGENARVSLAHDIFDANLPGDHHSAVDDDETYSVDKNTIYVRGDIKTKYGRNVGFWERTIHQNDDGTLVVGHDNLRIDSEAHMSGLGSAFIQHAVSEYKKIGVDHIEVYAGDSVGGYMWAREGFRLKSAERREKIHEFTQSADNINGVHLSTGKITQEEHDHINDQIQALRIASTRGEDVQPIHVAAIGHNVTRWQGEDDYGRQYETWVGKEAMLGKMWAGDYFLDYGAVTASAVAHLVEALACHDASCRPPTSGGTGGSRSVGALPNGANPEVRYGKMLRSIGISDPNNIGPEYDDANDEKRAANFRTQVSDLHGAVRSRIQPSQLESILKVGMLSQHDTGISGGMLNPAVREMHETEMFGTEETRPVYGYVHTTDTLGSRLAQYGPIAVVFKDEVNDRTTVTYGDSLNESYPPAPVRLTDVKQASTIRLSMASTESGDHPGYVEAQIHGQIRPGDIAKLVIDKQTVNYGDEHRFELIKGLAKHAGIPVEEATDEREFKTYGKTYDVLHFGADGMRLVARRGETGAWADVEFNPATDNVELRTPGQPVTTERWQVALKFGGWTRPNDTIIAAAERYLAFACHDAACAPPPAGVGGSSPLQARRGVVPGYTSQARRDIHLAGVRVTYKPDYPDDHPDPGEVVWAKVRYQENTALSKDRPVLIIGRINGTDKLAAVQLTSQITGQKNQHVVGPGSWDRLGRNSAVKLDQIIVIDPKDYRREGSKFERGRFDDVIGRLAAYHRTPVTIAAGGTWVELYNHNHDAKDGKFTSGSGGHRIITKAEARGDSRPVSHAEFQRLAGIGQTQLEGFARNAKKIDLTDEQWSTVKRAAYAEAVKPWGGATIDMHTGHQLPQGAEAYAVTVKSLKGKTIQNSVSVHENATEAEFHAAMEVARKRFGYTLAREQHYLGVFHDDENHRIDIDPVLVVTKREDVDTIGAATHAIGGAYKFSDGNGYWPPHVAEG